MIRRSIFSKLKCAPIHALDSDKQDAPVVLAFVQASRVYPARCTRVIRAELVDVLLDQGLWCGWQRLHGCLAIPEMSVLQISETIRLFPDPVGALIIPDVLPSRKPAKNASTASL